MPSWPGSRPAGNGLVPEAWTIGSTEKLDADTPTAIARAMMEATPSTVNAARHDATPFM